MARGMQDIILATAVLVERCGASGFDIGFTGDGTGASEDANWYAQCYFQGARLMVGDRHSPEEACLALSIRLLDQATCRCLRPVSISDDRPGCRWRLIGAKWEPGCTAPSIPVPGAVRGDYAAIQQAVAKTAATRGQYTRQGKSGRKRRR